MVKLNEALVLARSRATDLDNVRKFNCWGSDLSDVRIIRQMPNVQVLSLSVNKISTLGDFAFCKNLEELYIRKNAIEYMNEICYLKTLPKLRILWLSDNPCASDDNYRMTVLKHLPNLQKLDNIPVQEDEVNSAIEQGDDLLPPQAPTESLDIRPSRAARPIVSTANTDQHSVVSMSMPAFSVLRSVTDTGVKHQVPDTGARNQVPDTGAASDKDRVTETGAASGKDLVTDTGVTNDKDRVTDTSEKDLVTDTGATSEKDRVMDTGATNEKDRVTDTGATSEKDQVSDNGAPADKSQAMDSGASGEKDQHSHGNSSSSAEGATSGEQEDPTENPDTLSWEETNKIRVQLGLKALSVEKVTPMKPRITSHGARSRNANLLQATLHLVKELDAESLEIVSDAIRNRLEIL